MHRLTYQAFLLEELEITDHQAVRKAFDKSVETKCVPGATVEDFISWVLWKHQSMICTKMILQMVHSQKHHLMN